MISVRAACHVHSDWSYDRKWSLERIAAAFAWRGYRIVMLTEHDRRFNEARRRKHRQACHQASSNRILLLPGIDYSDAANCVHILTWGDTPFVGENVETEKVLASVAAAGGAAVFAHPSRKEAWERFKPRWNLSLRGIGCWNRKTDGWAPSQEAWRLLETTKAVPFVGMDFHHPRQFFPLSTVLQVKEPVTEAAVLASLRSGRCCSKAFGLPVGSFGSGFSPRALHCAGYLRRRAAFAYHHLRGRARARLF